MKKQAIIPKQRFQKIISLLLITIGLQLASFAQTSSVMSESKSVRYDSTKNYLGKNVRQYIGQELYLRDIKESRRSYGYSGFIIDYTKSSYNTYNVYKCCTDFNKSIYSDMVGKYFTVLDVIEHPKASESKTVYGNTFYIKLREKQSKDILYYEYEVNNKKFPFVVIGYLLKMKQLNIGQSFTSNGTSWDSVNGIQAGSLTSINSGSIWKCVDLIISEKDFKLAMVLKNSKNEKVICPFEGRVWKIYFSKNDSKQNTSLNKKISTPRRSSKTVRRSYAVRCGGITKKGARCKRKTTNTGGYCWQHD